MNAISGSDLRSSFAQGILALLERVEYRRVKVGEDMEEVGRLRELSYKTSKITDREKFGSFIDSHDSEPDCPVIGVYIDEQLVSTLRCHVVAADRLHGPTATYFPARAAKLVENGKCYIDPSRFAADREKLWQYPILPLLTLRIAAAASEYFNASYCMSCIWQDDAKFYSKSFGATEIEEPIFVEGMSAPVVLLGAKIEDIRHRIATRYPFFHSSELERRMLFAPESALDYLPLNILPSAKHVLKSMGIQPSVQSVNL